MTFDDEYNPSKIGKGKSPSDAELMARVKQKSPEFHKGVLKANEGTPIEQQLNPDPGLPGELEDVAQAAARVAQSDASMARLQLLSVLSCCLQPHFDAYLYWTKKASPLSLYTFVVAGSGEGKTTTFNALTEGVSKWAADQRRRYAREKSLHDKTLVDAKKSGQGVDIKEPVLDKRTYKNPTIEALRNNAAKGYALVFWRNDEAAMMIGGHILDPKKQLDTFGTMATLWDGSDDESDRVTTGSVYLENPRVTLGWASQLEPAKVLFGNPLALTSGFVPRFLLYHSPSNPGGKVAKAPMDEDLRTLERFNNKVKALMDRPLDLYQRQE